MPDSLIYDLVLIVLGFFLIVVGIITDITTSTIIGSASLVLGGVGLECRRVRQIINDREVK